MNAVGKEKGKFRVGHELPENMRWRARVVHAGDVVVGSLERALRIPADELPSVSRDSRVAIDVPVLAAAVPVFVAAVEVLEHVVGEIPYIDPVLDVVIAGLG